MNILLQLYHKYVIIKKIFFSKIPQYLHTLLIIMNKLIIAKIKDHNLNLYGLMGIKCGTNKSNTTIKMHNFKNNF